MRAVNRLRCREHRGSGGMARCENDAAELLSKAAVLKGGAFPGATIGDSKQSVTDWVDSIVTIRK